MNISFEEIGSVNITLPSDDITPGHVCMIHSDGSLKAPAAGGRFCGVIHTCRDHKACVQVCGFVTVGYTGNTPAIGYDMLSANGSGGVKKDTAGKEYLIVDRSETAQTVTLQL